MRTQNGAQRHDYPLVGFRSLIWVKGRPRIVITSGERRGARKRDRREQDGVLDPDQCLETTGEVAFGFGIQGFRYAGVFRYDPVSQTVSPVLLPDDAAPGETTFRGSDFHIDLNNAGTIATVGVIETPDGHCNDASICAGLGRGVYTFDRFNNVAVIAAPGAPAPNSGKFDDAWNPNLNNGGDVIFGGHVKGETCIPTGALGCTESLYLYTASTRKLSSVAHQGQSAPGGGTFLIAGNGRLNAGGDASFFGTLKCNNDACSDVENGLFLRKRDGTLLAVARPAGRHDEERNQYYRFPRRRQPR